MEIIIDYADFSELEQMQIIEQKSIKNPWSLASFISEFELSTSRLIVAKNDENIVVGYATYSVVLGEIYINNIAVDSNFRQNGIAKKLLTFIYEENKIGGEAILLEVRASNIKAINLYKSQGFFECGKRKNFYDNPKEDGIIFRKEYMKN